MPKLGKFLFFDNFFLDLANFQDLNNFFDFLAIFSLPLISKLSILLLPTPNHSRVNFSNSIVVYSIEINRATILLKP